MGMSNTLHTWKSPLFTCKVLHRDRSILVPKMACGNRFLSLFGRWVRHQFEFDLMFFTGNNVKR